MDNEQIKALAEAYLSPHFLNEHEGYNVTEEEIFAAGYHAGRAALDGRDEKGKGV